MIAKQYVKPHQVKSRVVEDADMPRVIEDAKVMMEMCHEPIGLYTGGQAIAHQQVTQDDPLRFFVTKAGEIIINPTIERHTRTPVDNAEGCLSFPDKRTVIVQRFHKCEVMYTTPSTWEGPETNEKLAGPRAFIFQHEIDHFDCLYIYEVTK